MDYEEILAKLPTPKLQKIVTLLNLPLANFQKSYLIYYLKNLLSQKDEFLNLPAIIEKVYMETNATACLNKKNVKNVYTSDSWPVEVPFFNIVDTVVSPSYITQGDQVSRFLVNFKLTAQQTKKLNTRKAPQIQLRFCFIDEFDNQAIDRFPDNVDIFVNQKIVHLPPIIPSQDQTVIRRRYNPVNITPFTKFSATNTVHMTYRHQSPGSFLIGIYLAAELSPSQLVSQIKARPIRPADETRRLIIEKLNGDGDVITTMLKVSLNCPLSRMRLKLPCRSSECNHFQCFDAEMYVQMNSMRSTWICPICNQIARFDALIIDGYFQEILNSSLLTDDDEVIELQRDGSWSLSKAASEDEIDILQSTVNDISANELCEESVILISDDENDDDPKAFSIASSLSPSSTSSDGSPGREACPDPLTQLFSAESVAKDKDSVEQKSEDMDEEPIARRLRRNYRPKTDTTLIKNGQGRNKYCK